ncbi:hypothetical protein ABL78_4570 [Leptomonas seymouri]|uniref:Uncharacterized protein n=1 Tax=Leptomonas seymouri TaxID=5684 RepID=A0A0N1IKL8_LEPSE|nr:hypothetical protein ABL78_4570 [Leptomonas seymouri]|eukprot:KPI86384.1 hypothetical protein ABL78_4570 [Leptomonas seymouri]
MMLTKEEIQTITLNAKFVHKHADQVFFASEINNAPQRIGDQPFLNFFVRYHRRDAPERYSWSRVRRVLSLEDAIAEAQRAGTAPPAASPTMVWRGKTMWVCLAVEPVQPHTHECSTSTASTADVKEELVMLPQLSNTVPENDEVLAYCVASANQRPTEKYTDGVLGDAPVVAPVLAGPEKAEATTMVTVVDAEGSAAPPNPEAATAVTADVAAGPPASLNPRLFVPTHRQVELLRQYKKQHFTHHQWTEEEIELSKALRQRYSSIGVAAAPVRTVAYEHEHRVVERKHRAAATANPAENLLGHVEITQDPLSEQQSEPATKNGRDYPATQTQRSISSSIPPASPSATVALNEAPLSPFLPRSILRQQQQQQRHRLSAPTFAARVLSDEPLSTATSGANASASLLSPSQFSQTLTQDAVTNGSSNNVRSSQNAESPSVLSQHLSQIRAAEDSFFKYISDEKRSYYLNRLANITLRNSETNAQNRRRGIANERRLERKGNLLESRGLWITDDKERAKQAEDYVKASVSGSSDAQNNENKRAAKNAVAGSGAGENSDTAKGAEDVFVEKFKAYHDAQRIAFSDCSDDLLSGTDADVESIIQAAAAAATEGAATASSPTANNGSDVSSPLRVSRRAVRRLLPNRLNTEEASSLSVQAQLVHRSTLRMAKRVREE